MKLEERETKMNDNAQPEGFDPEPDFGPEPWLNANVEGAIINLQEILYDEGCSVNGLEIVVPSTPGDNFKLHTDYGTINVVAKEIA